MENVKILTLLLVSDASIVPDDGVDKLSPLGISDWHQTYAESVEGEPICGYLTTKKARTDADDHDSHPWLVRVYDLPDENFLGLGALISTDHLVTSCSSLAAFLKKSYGGEDVSFESTAMGQKKAVTNPRLAVTQGQTD